MCIRDRAEVPAKKGYRVLAITACPTGIAHTYMAAESLQKAGDSLNTVSYTHLDVYKRQPYDYYTKEYKKGLQLYSSGVLIMENC